VESNGSNVIRQFNLYIHFVQQVTTLKEQIGVYSTDHVDGITGGRERFARAFSIPNCHLRRKRRYPCDRPGRGNTELTSTATF